MPTIKTAKDPLRLHYESVANQALRHSQWAEIRSHIIRCGMRLTRNNVAKYARFRQVAPRTHLTLANLEAYQQFVNQYGSQQEFVGIELLEIAQKLHPAIRNKPQQLRKQFYRVGLNCDRNSIYNFADACKAIASVILYKPKSCH